MGAPDQKGKRIAGTIKLLTGLGLIGILVYFADLDELAQHWRTINPWFLLAALLCMQTGIMIQVIRWRLSLLPLSLDFRYLQLFWVNYIGLFFNNFLPGSVSGDAVKVYYLGRRGNWGRLTVGTVITRALGFVSLFATNAILLLLALSQSPSAPWNAPLLALGFLVLAAVGMIVLYNIPRRTGIFLSKRLLPPIKSRARLRQLFDHLEIWRAAKGMARWNLGLSFLYTIIGIAFTIYFCARAAGIELPPAIIMATGLTVITLSILPISFNGLGVAEASYAALLGVLGTPLEEALTLALLMRLLLLFQGLLGGAVYLSTPRQASTPGDIGTQKVEMP